MKWIENRNKLETFSYLRRYSTAYFIQDDTGYIVFSGPSIKILGGFFELNKGFFRDISLEEFISRVPPHIRVQIMLDINWWRENTQ